MWETMVHTERIKDSVYPSCSSARKSEM